MAVIRNMKVGCYSERWQKNTNPWFLSRTKLQCTHNKTHTYYWFPFLLLSSPHVDPTGLCALVFIKLCLSIKSQFPAPMTQLHSTHTHTHTSVSHQNNKLNWYSWQKNNNELLSMVYLSLPYCKQIKGAKKSTTPQMCPERKCFQ